MNEHETLIESDIKEKGVMVAEQKYTYRALGVMTRPAANYPDWVRDRRCARRTSSSDSATPHSPASRRRRRKLVDGKVN